VSDSQVGRVLEQQLAPGLLRWTLSNPRKRNALAPDMLAWLARRAGELRGEVVLLDGEGDASFCAGFDLDALPADNVLGDMSEAPDAPLFTATAALRRADATLIAVLHGPVFGAGVELACSCDLRLAETATRFVIPAARLGVVYHPEGLRLLHACFGAALTTRLLLLGESIGADEALRAGCLHGVHPADALEAAALATAERLRAGAPQSLRAHRDRLRALTTGGPLGDEARAAYEAARRSAYTSADHREGQAATRERRPPRFTGR
jgi:enoyl-CoA hydratase/carnithine racemase